MPFVRFGLPLPWCEVREIPTGAGRSADREDNEDYNELWVPGLLFSVCG